MLRAEQLPLHVRKRLGLSGSSRKRARPSRAGQGKTIPCVLVCQACGARCPNELEMDRHQSDSGHTHYAIPLMVPTRQQVEASEEVA